MDFRFLTLALALAVDKVFGEPDLLWKNFPHPIIWFGKLIEWAEAAFNRDGVSPYAKRRDGFLVIAVLLAIAALAGVLLHWVFLQFGIAGLIAEALVASVFLAHKSLVDHVFDVARALQTGGLDAGREAVGRIVGRDTAVLDDAGVSRAAIESLAENFADGVIAPAFWYLVAGLPGLLAYKMLNTADSMIGHLNDRYRDFGRASAKLDDVANFVPARLTGLLYAFATLVTVGLNAGKRAFSTMMRDARLHRSPNSGWPEAALAGGLNIALAGPRIYKGITVNEPLLNSGGKRNVQADDIVKAIQLTNMTHAAFVLLIVGFAIISLC
ncbi:MAG: adenosylcobinamide-phosphate synthase CbiB [Rhizobiaceae bacterium]